MLDFFIQLEEGIVSAMQDGRLSPRRRYSLEVARLGRRLYESGGTKAWCGVLAPFELLGAMGVTSCFAEFFGAMLASVGAAGGFIEAADRFGYSSDACSFHRSVFGAALSGSIPVPDILVGTSSPCSGGLALIENLARHFRRPMFVLHIPQDMSEGNVAYLAGQLRRLVGFVTEQTGMRLTEARLRQAVENTNRFHEAASAVYRLAANVPSPTTSRELSNFGIVVSLFLGNEGGLEVAEAYRQAFSERIAPGQGAIPPEKIRLLWIQNRIQFRQPLDKLLEEHGAVIVSDELNDLTWAPIDPDDPFTGIAKRIISVPFNGTMASRVEHLIDLARRYRVHGAVNPCNWGCRQGTGGRGLIEAGLRKIGVPVLNLEVDCVDHRKFAEGQVRTRLEAFLEMLRERPSPWD